MAKSHNRESEALAQLYTEWATDLAKAGKPNNLQWQMAMYHCERLARRGKRRHAE